MIGVLFTEASSDAGRYVLAALRRSVSVTQAQPVSRNALRDGAVDIAVAVDLPDIWGAALLEWLHAGSRKLVIFGRLPAAFAAHLGHRDVTWPAGWPAASRSEPAPSHETRESRAAIHYRDRAQVLGGDAWRRPFERFDFTDEWNNLGYGAIRGDGSIWALTRPVDAPADTELAAVTVDGERIGSYASLTEFGDASVLWFNRAVGPLDSFEWRLVETFLADHRYDALPCCPVLSEIPAGCDAVVTSRLDCDEDVESARPLWDAYRRLGIPFSLAVNTSNLDDSTHHGILRELLADGGAVLSHTATHAPNWGGSYERALAEGGHSAAMIERATGGQVRYAVSPFHQSPPYALRALADAGYDGCVGGIIRNDPEFVLARGGMLAGLPEGFIGHSQQCMLHGECMLSSGDPLAVFTQAFDLAYATRTLFGYLDHPFSPRYQYGWPDEATRIDAHERFVAYIRTKAAKPLFLHEAAALDFLRFKASIRMTGARGKFRAELPDWCSTPLAVVAEYRGERRAVESGVLFQ
ncbi:polysaccharide deacetylase [Burkholderia diffusa]|uniref:Polysaccharide deacetylase n=1 Tax=Burkholderia diffusa TaxID=488732 RepID=A0AAW3PKF3_9BURK|nr:polysaccharide deacetylase family protein [Burkholderia diffusa]KWF27806.1 polysaccharide deacetylase [Burkholderia diffusa]KWF31608.1 polysaccharide deacetylase [Burkholderia diffusa]KWF42949.1 polysaccharide deacetylase [Burkholderia diffusa]KWF57209.1 polysaccharide deacetylase [Burkholderia diffusa]